MLEYVEGLNTKIFIEGLYSRIWVKLSELFFRYGESSAVAWRSSTSMIKY